MSIKEGKTLMSYEEDIQGTGMIEWMKGKSETLQTLHRYEGDLILYEDKLVFEGIDTESMQDFTLKITPEDIEEIHFGSDRVFTGEGEEMDVNFEPLRITFYKEGLEHVIYLLTDFNRMTLTADNEDWHEVIEEWMKS